jgi:hypothetical protein
LSEFVPNIFDALAFEVRHTHGASRFVELERRRRSAWSDYPEPL